MPSLFGSRRYTAPVQPLTRETADPDAATAAASAFMRRGSNASLSSAAAAAALRARPTTPTNVGQVQSRRSHRRSPSTSSLGGRDGKAKKELQRSPSVGSMIERTFRSPSPGREPLPRARNVPPVPSVPTRIAATNGTMAPLNTQPLRTASDRLSNGQGGSWFAGATTGDGTKVKRPDIVIHSCEPRAGSVSPSINFSYPRAMMHSPTPSMEDQTLVYDANSRRMIPRADLIALSQSLDASFEKPRKKKGQQADVGASAPRLAACEQEADDGDASGQALKRKKKKSAKAQSGAPGDGALDGDGSMARPPLVKKPSVVQEEPEIEAQEDDVGDKMDKQASDKTGVGSGQEQKGSSGGGNLQGGSESPGRLARFASRPEQVAVKHEPPPRSISPRKSAMKLGNARGVSPCQDDAEAAGGCLSANKRDDKGLVRKKSARVSWDDRKTVVVGESAPRQEAESPVMASPQPKKAWHSIVSKHVKRESAGLSQDETMGPRPALPQFGSVREKKSKEVEERPLVRPWDKRPESAAGDGTSCDAAVGSALAQDFSSRNAANISKYREPLPANAEAGGKEADSDAEAEAKEGTPRTAQEADKAVEREGQDGGGGGGEAGQGAGAGAGAAGGAAGGGGQGEEAEPALPGGFPGDVEAQAEAQAEAQEEATGTMHDIREEEEETDRCSIYSDACEDLGDVDGPGFMSLDAIVESRGGPRLKKKVQEHAWLRTKSQSPSGDDGSHEAGAADTRDEWEQAKAYWKSLTTEERRRLELEALAEGGDDEGPGQASDEGALDRSYQIQPGSTWDAEAAQRAVAAPQPKMRQSLRGQTADGLRKTMRRPMSAQMSAPRHQHVRTQSAQPQLRRQASDDSVSSFKRSRRASASAHGFPRSMRHASPTPLRGSGRFSLRSLSPPPFRRSSIVSVLSTPGSMRSEPLSPTARPRRRVSSLNPLGRRALKPASSSRFADSSDEDEPGPFSSRFVDSSDDDDDKPSLFGATSGRLKLLPARATSQPPRRPDSPPRRLDSPPPPQDDDSYRPASRRSSIMAILRRRRPSSPKISRDLAESAARRGTRLERTPDQLASIRSTSTHRNRANWPLPDDSDNDNGSAHPTPRPATARPTPSSRPHLFLRRRHTASHDDTAFAPQPRKKFAALRRMFGIDD
ncbi:hypothetical protein CDD81_1061 [Ophiocordyceps australis]|uniref:Uncharacterized protein n=1 Tax=Ophiocordyceps australis TaxID=1399860 RepID=A0A2C5Y0I8_9HYPO|nr:hypothetical protein CDD81_1061 [Ophiocordyceps australis]